MKQIALILSLVLLLSGCGGEVMDYTLNTASATETTIPETIVVTEPKEYREFAIYPVEQPSDNVVGNLWYYTNARLISYFDTELRRKVVLCSQPNCTHSSRDCTAFLGGNQETSYQVVGDIAYALINDSDKSGQIHFVAQNLITGERQLLWDLTPEKPDTMREYFQLSIDGSTAFLTFTQYDMEWKETGGYTEANKANYAYGIDLKTRERELLLVGEIPSHDLLALEGSHLVTQTSTEEFLLIYEVGAYSDLPLSMEEYLEENPYGDYYAYCEKFGWPETESAYYSVNRKTGEKTRVNIHYQDISGPFREKKLAFADGDAVYIYDGHTGQVTRCFSQERLAMVTYKDGRIIFNVFPEGDDESAIYEYYWYDLTTGELHQFQKGISLMVFSVHGETRDYFYGNYQGRNCFISKQDFYNENYDAAF